MEEGHVRLSEAARRLGVGRTTARKWFDQGLLRGRELIGRGDRQVEEASIEELRTILLMPRGPLRDAALLGLQAHNAEVQGR